MMEGDEKMRTAYPFLFGTIVMEYEDHVLTGLSCQDESYRIPEEEMNARTAFTDAVMKQVEDYLAGKRKSIDVDYRLEGTEFQRKVWNVLSEIPYGETRSYKQIAEAMGTPMASRAVGRANNQNPVLLIVPCHRVIGTDGSLTGYAGGLAMKEYLLNLERGQKTTRIPE